MTVISLDQSLTATGVAIFSDEHQEFFVQTIKPKQKGVERLVEIRSQITHLVREYCPNFILMEDYASGAKGRNFSLGELGGMIKILCSDIQIPLVIIPIGTHKIYTTGSGNTKKDLMLKSVYKKYQMDVDDDNQADAISMLKLFLGYIKWLKDKHIELNKDELRAIKKLNSLLQEAGILDTLVSATVA